MYILASKANANAQMIEMMANASYHATQAPGVVAQQFTGLPT
jgi:hypothetical protein